MAAIVAMVATGCKGKHKEDPSNDRRALDEALQSIHDNHSGSFSGPYHIFLSYLSTNA